MGFKTKINAFRRKATRAMTKYIGRSNQPSEWRLSDQLHVQRVLICRPNHRLGNQLLVTPLVQEIITYFPDCKIDLFVKGGVAPIIFQNYRQVDNIIMLPKKAFKDFLKYIRVWFQLRKHSYDLVINIDKCSSSGRLSTQLAKGKYKFFCDSNAAFFNAFPDVVHIAKEPVYNFRYYMTCFGFQVSDDLVPSLDIKLNDIEKNQGKQKLYDLVNNHKPTICLFTFATGKKCYGPDWWHPFYELLIKTFPEYNFIEMLPIENVSQIDFRATSFYSGDIREMASILHNTTMFIGADSGIMHLASAAPTTTVGLFSVTKIPKYEPYGHQSIAVNTLTMSHQEIIKVIQNVLQTNVS